MRSCRGAALSLLLLPLCAGELTAGELPRYAHIFVIVAENKGLSQIMKHPEWTPEFHALAAEYGVASDFYAEVHPSEGNYVAMLGGDTFGIHDDDAFFCKPGLKSEFCEKSETPDYADHRTTVPMCRQTARKGISRA